MMTNKNKCFDFFQKAKVDDKRLYEKSSYKTVIQFKIKKREKENLKQKLQLLIGLQCFQGYTYIRMMLKLIEVTKQLFITDIESGDEVYISSLISLSCFPMSFHYYDPIQHFIQEHMSDQKKEHFRLKNKLILENDG